MKKRTGARFRVECDDEYNGGCNLVLEICQGAARIVLIESPTIDGLNTLADKLNALIDDENTRGP